jgi:carbonic anhydrase
VSSTDDLLQNARDYAASFDKGEVPLRPARKVAVLACMDSRMDLVGLLGLELGDAHMIRNAGGVVTDDAIRSLAISQRMLGTREIVLLHHTDCGMQTFSDDDFKRSLLDEDVRQSIARIQASPFIPHKDSVRGFVYDVHSGEVREVS